ncbi:uncharacterized protein KQ657_003882 [Scheffersomyces spartinae]|uniref:Uncharacterized protein n=1 Tax=Scheffersomyces spartinae TaxID=45513 RepID=A0A9P7VDK5_9ASCO|nr:uncharacterized protein KQ657_003882 [Scheffersomyces spartinae]KAG7195354.1 hypothetical protein KQ657_003882 [Scheffersomyces spartinae]
MSFKFPSFNLQSLQELLPTVEDLKTNAAKTAGNLQKSFQQTGDLFTQQVHNLAQQNNGSREVEVSELPEEYLKLEKNCDLLLRVYTDFIKFNHETFDKVSYDYPPANNAISKLKNANVSGFVNNKFSQLKNVSSPQELEKILLGKSSAEDAEAEAESGEEQARIKTLSARLPSTLYGNLATFTQHHSDELKESNSPLSFGLLQFSSAYLEIASSRLEMDDTIVNTFSAELVRILNNQLFTVNEMRKRVYAARLEFDAIRAQIGDEEEDENEELIAKEDELVSATEVAVVEMKKLLKPSVSLDLLKVFVTAQKEWFELSAKKLKELLASLERIEDEDHE